ncbi:TlpA family protein disulfide reductase [Halalkalicoccus jeotgali]|uniref:Thioredoxin 2 n=1 Tax=Halalkalicoccus jeotgali (strain DSM 18796 / CECT 7217 / JCM 14584 / KCTC 4019 / B3) TaxID=795797 RepID=D8J865_HALJB|nr:TlpA disulfide reductase family protein [Halalkalicoccus jeotgali]ADJ14178.1 thioredoxin 2 [Halalkalicoccus jeotgali B3]ELY34640.1 thioredoxin 2 [Halalkalicoccus jeotgali B3]
MRRRDLLAGVASAGVVGAGAWAVSTTSLGGGYAPLTLETIAAPGSDAGEIRVPERGRVSFLDFFGTWCGPCETQMPALATSHERVADTDVQFVSITNEPVGTTLPPEDVAEWWAENGGAWTVAHDAEHELTERHDVTRLPTAVVLDAENTVTWSHTGLAEADRLVGAIEDAR